MLARAVEIKLILNHTEVKLLVRSQSLYANSQHIRLLQAQHAVMIVNWCQDASSLV